MKTSPQRDTATTSEAMQPAGIDGGQLEYETRGEGEPVLLIHGAHIANAFLPLMDEGVLGDFRLIRHHRLGYARSMAAEGPPSTYVERAAADAQALLQHLGVQHAHIAGHSSGGVVALQAEQNAATFFELELPAVGAWEFDAEKATQISQPILFVGGSESGSLEKEGKELVHSWWPLAEDHVVSGVNHLLQMQDPRSVAEAIADFLGRHPL